MRYREFLGHKFMSGEDFEPGEERTLTIAKAIRVKARKPPKYEEEAIPCLTFKETDQRMVVNRTNGRIVKQICGSNDTKNWSGHKITVYHDPAVMFGPDVVGGIRVKAETK